MTRFSIAIDSAGQQGRPTYSDSLGFIADTLTIVNPTVSTVYILAGGSTVPTSYANATDSVPPLSVRSLPVNSATFAVGFGAPTYPVTQPNPTTVATLLFTAGEPTPQYGAIPPAAFQLSGTINVSITNASINANITNASINANITNSTIDANITNSTIDAVGLLPSYAYLFGGTPVAAGTYTGTVTLPAGTRGIAATVVSPANVSALTITGHQSTQQYLALVPSATPAMAGAFITVPILSDDTSLDYSFTVASGTGAFKLYTSSGLLTVPQAADGPALARVVPPTTGATGFKASETAVPTGTAAWTILTGTAAATGYTTYATSFACSCDPLTTAGAAGARITLWDAPLPGGTLRAVLGRVVGQVGAGAHAESGCRVLVPAGWQVRGEVYNLDGTARTIMVSFTLEQETY